MPNAESNQAPCFIDTNIFLYAFIESQSEEKSVVAGKLIQNKAISISTQVINEVCVNLLKKAGFSEENIRLLIDSFYDRYTVVELSKELLLKASELREQHQFSYWDSLIVSSALYSEATILYSEDLHDGLVVENRLRIVNPFK
jgi:predicted nucleic acid-binding protein